MKISLKRTIAKMLCLTTFVCSIATPLVACKKDDNTGGGGDDDNTIKTDSSALILATDILDTVFNPYFYTSGADGEIVSQTQIGMLSSDEKGELIANWNEPCVSLDWSIVKTGKKENMTGPNDYSNYYTDYYFAIKDDIKFSDGELLTKDDVLFNLYMYLDPAYTGSNTMYSVKIQGLTEYRTQTPDLDNAAEADAFFQQSVDGRVSAIVAWAYNDDAVWGDEGFADYEFYENEKVLESDINKVQEYYKTSLQETWTSVLSADIEKEYEKYKDKDGKLVMTEPYQLFLYYNGAVHLDEKWTGSGANAKIDYYEYRCDYDAKEIPGSIEERKSDAFRDKLIKYVYDTKFIEQKQATTSYKDNLIGVLYSYPVNVYMQDYLMSDVKYRKFKDNKEVKNISGIEILPKQSYIPDNSESGDSTAKKTLKDKDGNPKQYDVLHIRINGVDPKAKQNFAFTVAPGHYYAPADEWKKAVEDTEDKEFFGVKFSDPTFMDNIRVNHLPVGAGPFRAAKSSGGAATTKSEFSGSDNIVNFEANPYFMLGEPKIKKLRYKVTSSTQLYNAVKTGSVDYASPSMKMDDIEQLEKDTNIHSESADNLGYGYIGVSARYIPNIYIRKAIMSTFDAESCIDNYYGRNGGSVIYRPMSKTLTDYYDNTWTSYYEFDSTGETAKKYLLDGGCYADSNGVWYDNTGKKMKYTFTIAGDSDDHPANDLFKQSREILTKLGVEINITHDSTALSRLSSGLLTVWAAAWSSSSDPDMYQVYHKDSQATSTTAWGYKYIFSSEFTELEQKDNPDNYDQRQMIRDLSDLIDDGRETDDTKARQLIYNNAMNALMDLAVEFPTYQRKVYYIWRDGVFDESTMIRGAGNVTTYQSPLSRIWEVEITKK